MTTAPTDLTTDTAAANSPAAEPELPGLELLPAKDQVAIGTTLTTLTESFARRQADPLTAAYTDDADWVNAFGSVKKGRDEIVEYLRGLFADANFDAGRLVAPPRTTLRRLTDDAVVVSSHLQVAGQGLVGGGEIELRNNHSLHVLQRQDDGRWLIVSEMFSDARTDTSYLHHS